MPTDVGHRPKWELAVEMIDELTVWGVSPPVVVADAGYGDNRACHTALTSGYQRCCSDQSLDECAL